jgi:hypothetical protein
MITRISASQQTRILMALLACLSMAFQCETTVADGQDAKSSSAAPTLAHKSHVSLRHWKDRTFNRHQPTFLITHGMGGTEAGDRFHQLADAIHLALPESNVVLIDWSKESCQTTDYLGIPMPWRVANSIDAVAAEAVVSLKTLQLNAARTTFIGESFGNCVNARISEQLGRQSTILAFNPPSCFGGYPVPDLRSCAAMSWSFQTYAAYDTQAVIADVGFFLETQPNSSEKEQHIAGISWLAIQVHSGRQFWLIPRRDSVSPQVECFDAVATLSGEILQEHPTRMRPTPVNAESPSVELMASTPRS